MKKDKVLKVVRIIFIAFISVVIALGITGYLVIHKYINKMNLIKDNPSYEVTDNLIEETDEKVIEDVTDTSDSPQAAIDELDETILNNINDKDQEISSNDVYNILLIGCDTRETGGSGRSDAMVIVSINSKTKTIVLTSLLRDIYLSIPSHKNNRLNAAYAYGGADLLVNTIEENFQIEIDKYISMDFYAFIDVVDSIDGVTLEVKEEYIPIINFYIKEINQHNKENENDDLLTQAGNYVLNGKQTLGYIRNRYVGTDFERTARQRLVLQTIFNKIKDLNYLKILELSDNILPRVTTNLSENKILSLILSVPAYRNYEIEQWSIPMENSFSYLTINRMAVIGIDFEKNLKELHRKVYGMP
ncbi:MAG: hypothetical protein H6Q59_890 [Firmicutes bacterium]|nr:hypothetical protein [Bacillota bacterium]